MLIRFFEKLTFSLQEHKLLVLHPNVSKSSLGQESITQK